MRNVWGGILLLGCIASAGVWAQAFPSLDRTLELARQEAYRADTVDWASVQDRANVIAGEQGEEAAIRYVLQSLGDGHSSYRPAIDRGTGAAANDRQAPPAMEIVEDGGVIQGVPVLQINGWSGRAEAARAATMRVRKAVVERIGSQGCGIVLDFSRNAGGNMWPMLVGLAPLLTDGPVGYFRDRLGREQAIEKRADGIYLAGKPHFLNQAATELPASASTRIGIVIGARTASSGEITAIMFRGQAGTRFFGVATAGYSTANRVHPLPNGNAIALTTGVTLDRDRREYGAKVEPDERSTNAAEHAARWVGSGCEGGNS